MDNNRKWVAERGVENDCRHGRRLKANYGKLVAGSEVELIANWMEGWLPITENGWLAMRQKLIANMAEG